MSFANEFFDSLILTFLTLFLQNYKTQKENPAKFKLLQGFLLQIKNSSCVISSLVS